MVATESSLHVNNRQDPQPTATETPTVANGGTPKRKAEQGGGSTQTRAKRNRYISIAWYF